VIPASVYTGSGDAVAGLTPENFKASLGGKPVLVTAATYDSGPRSIVILIDASGSMIESGKLAWGLKFARDLVSSASPQDSLALLTFSDETEVAASLGQSRTDLLTAVDKLQNRQWRRVKGIRRTALEDALVNALALLKTPRVGDAICLVTDGGENASRSSQSKVEALLQSAGVRVCVFLPTWYGEDRGAAEQGAQFQSEMRDLTSATGGALLPFVPGQIRGLARRVAGTPAMSASDDEDLRRAAQLFQRRILSLIELDVTLPAPLAKPREWNLEVVDASGRRHKQLEVIYPHRLAPCGQPR
jgi:hypothetical protein